MSISTTAEARPTVRRLVEQVQVTDAGIDISVGTAALAEILNVATTEGAPAQLQLHAAVRLTRTGKAMRLIHGDGRGVAATPNPSLVRLLVKAHRWWKIMREGEVDLSTLGAQEGVAPAYITRVMRLAFLSPRTTAAILSGATVSNLDVATLTKKGAVTSQWSD
ncbi:hypothetical protein GGQ80_003571 [Sphingomonas jinjuensis]|uniref:Uncharacterized protein n=1 Tax=Sphingomonas jinjuensis TaxID=535907 RepID=A0A840FHJ9_9SPHN|nr:hypothetical protein [Sphingomonas jinjuensis]